MKRDINILKGLSFAGSLYFFLVSVAHLIGLKVPILFIYYNVPSYAYQDKIISFLAFGWSVFIFSAFLNPIKNSLLIRAILIAGAGAIIGLEFINTYTDFESFNNGNNRNIFRLETLGLATYITLLVIFYNKSKDKLK